MTNKEKDCEALRVADRPTESGIKINNILTALVLGVMSWVGLNINHLKDSLADIRIETGIQGVELSHTKELVDRHIMDKTIHK